MVEGQYNIVTVVLLLVEVQCIAPVVLLQVWIQYSRNGATVSRGIVHTAGGIIAGRDIGGVNGTSSIDGCNKNNNNNNLHRAVPSHIVCLYLMSHKRQYVMSMSVHKVRNASTNHSLAITNNLAESRS